MQYSGPFGFIHARLASSRSVIPGRIPLKLLAALLASGLMVTPAARAATITWSGAFNTTWNNAANWVGAAVPTNNTTSDTALFNSSTYTNLPNVGTMSVYGVAVGSGNTGGTLNISGTQLTLGADSVVGGNGGFQIASGSGAVTLSTATLKLGVASGLQQVYFLNNSANLFTVSSAITNNSSSIAARLTLDGSGSGVLSGVISNNTGTGTVAITKAGTGTWTMNGAAVNTYTGSTIINGGKLVLDFANLSTATDLINSGSALLLGGGTLEVKQKSGFATSQTFAGTTVNVGASTVTGTSLDAAGVTVALGGLTRTVVAGAGGGTVNFTLPTNGSITTSTANTNGILGTWATTGSGTSLKYATGGGAIAALTGTAAATAADLTDTTGTVNYDLTIATGATPATVSANTIRYTGGAATTAPGATSFTVNGLMNAGTGTWTIGTSPITIGANRELVIQANTQNTTISSVIANNGAGKSSLTYNGGGRLTLSGANTFTGDTTVLAGQLQTSGTTRTWGNLIVGSLGGGPAASFNPLNQTTLFDSTGIYNGTSNVTVYSNGTAYLSSTGDGYINNITVVGGTVNLGGSVYMHGAINMTGGTISGTLYGSSGGGFSVTTNASNSTATFGGVSVFQNTAATFSVADGSAAVDLNVTGVLNQGGTSQGITKSGAGLMQLTAANNYTGATTVNGGTLKAGVASVANVSGAFGKNSAVTLANTAGVTLDITGFNTQIGSLAGGGTTGGNVTLGAATLTTGAKNTDSSFAGVISGTGGLTKVGTGTQTFTRANTYTGTTTVSEGVLSLGVASSVSSSSNVVLGGGTLQSAFSQTLGTLNLSASSTLDLSTGGTFAFANSSALSSSWTGTLSIIGTFAEGASVRFGTNDLALTSGQLSQITINGIAASINSSGYLTSAVPEPSTYAAIFGVLALAGAVCQRRRVKSS
jgi:fibronectin-binding autotransporter adhesin